MGAKSTIDISRQNALSAIEEMLYNASDETIGDILEILNDTCDPNDDRIGSCVNFHVTSS